MTEIEILLKAKADLSVFGQIKSQFAEFQKGIAAGFNLNIGGQLAEFVLSIPEKLKALGEEAIEMGNHLKSAADSLGASAESVQVLGFVAEKAGGSLDNITKAAAKMGLALDAARDTGSKASSAFNTLGLDAAKLEQLPLERRFEAIAVAMVSAKDKTAAYAAASEILGAKNLPALMGALKELANGYDKAAKSATDAGLVMSDGTVERLERAQQNIEKFHKQIVIGTGEAIGTSMTMWQQYWKFLKENPVSGVIATVTMPAVVVSSFKKSADKQNADEDEAARRARSNQPPTAQPDQTSIQALIDRENELSVAKNNRLRIERIIAEFEAQVAAIENDPLLLETDKKDKLAEIYKKQAEAISLKADALNREFDAQFSVNKLMDRGFRATGSNAPDQVADRDVTGLGAIPAGNLTPAQAKALSDKRARDEALNANSQESRNNTRAGNDVSQNQFVNTSGGGFFKEMVDYLNQAGTLVEQLAGSIKTTLGTAVSSITTNISGWLTKTQSWQQALANIRSTIMMQLLQSIIQMGVQWVVNSVIIKGVMIGIEAVGDGLRTARVAKENAAEAATLPMKTAGAAASGISSFGVALIFGALAIALILGAMSAFATGGFTTPGAKEKPAGIVHAGEWVAPKWMVEDPLYGPMIANLEAGRMGHGGTGRPGEFGIGGWTSWGQFLGSGFLPKWAALGQGSFQEKWNLLDGTSLYGKKPDPESLSYDGKNWVSDMRSKAPAASPSSGGGSSSGASSPSGAAGDAGGAPVNVSVYAYIDQNELMRAWRRDPNNQKHIINVVRSSA